MERADRIAELLHEAEFDREYTAESPSERWEDWYAQCLPDLLAA
jgi:hypothetical protein